MIKHHFITFVVSIITVFSAFAYTDHIILKNGQESDVRLYQVNDERVVFSYDKNKNSQRHEIPSNEVYMIYIEGQGNMYFSLNGNRITGEPNKINPSKFDVIYLVEGKEIGAENIRITADQVIYDVKGKPVGGIAGIGGKSKITEERVNKSDVFMIRYRNGMSEIITPLPTEEIVEEVIEEPQTEPEPEFIVVFHSVKRGETLESICRTYNVSPENVIEWNDLPKNQKIKSPLKADMQLLIYQPNK